MKHLLIILAFLGFAFFNSGAQKPFAVKKWKDRYPKMKNDYPLTFVSFKGWLPPVPHFFVRIYPSHYYYYLYSYPTYDTKGYLDMALDGTLKTIFKNIDKKALKKSMEAVSGVKINQSEREEIGRFLRESRLTVLHDVYDVTGSFMRAGYALERLKGTGANKRIVHLFERELNGHLESFLMVNLMDAQQGDKIQAMAEIKAQLKSLAGVIDYSAQKIDYHQKWSGKAPSNLTFLGR